MRYLMKYKGKYRVLAHYDVCTNDYPRDSSGDIDSTFDDLYIPCKGKAEITHYGKSILSVLIPSLKRGHNLIDQINEINKDIIIDLYEMDSEIEFKFHAKHMDVVAEVLCAKTNGADTSPFSKRNLPKAKYIIPDEDLAKYKELTANFTMLQMKDVYSKFNVIIIKKFKKQNKSFDLVADKRLKMLKSKEYIHSIGMWDEFIKFITRYK